MIIMLLKSPLQVRGAADIKLSRSIFQYIHPERMRIITQTPRVGFEPTTDRLTADCSTIELPRKKGFRQIYTTGAGFEPTTDRLIPARRDSTIELPRKIFYRRPVFRCASAVSSVRDVFYTGQSRNRTGDTRIFSPLLYQLSYLPAEPSNLRYHAQNCKSIADFYAPAVVGSAYLSYYKLSTSRPDARVD